MADGAASVTIGLLLASVAWVLANETRSLIAGEAVAPMVMERLKEALSRVDCITDLEEVATLHLGPGAILVALTLAFRRDSTTDMIEEAIRDVTEVLQKADERVVYVYVRPSERVTNPDRKRSSGARQARCASLRFGLSRLRRCGGRRAWFWRHLLYPRIDLGVDLGDVALQGRPHVADGLGQGSPRVGNLFGGPCDLFGGSAAVQLQCGDFRLDASEREEEQEVEGEEYDHDPPEHVPRPHVFGNDLQHGAGEVRRLGRELLTLVCKVALHHRRSSRRIIRRKANIDHSTQKRNRRSRIVNAVRILPGGASLERLRQCLAEIDADRIGGSAILEDRGRWERRRVTHGRERELIEPRIAA